MALVSAVFLALAAIGAVYYVLSTVALVACFRGKPATPSADIAPTVSVLKPVCGIDKDAEANFASYLAQDYPNYEVLFGVLEASDPAIGVILDCIQGNKQASLHIGTTIRGVNNKVRVLHQLAKHAGGEIIVVTDADTRARTDFLNAMVAPFEDENVGVVTCLYKGTQATTLGDTLEGLHMTCTFAPGVACARWLRGLDFGLGAAIAIRAAVLPRIGGFERIVDYLADDYQLGHLPARLGYKVELSKYVMEDVLSGQGLMEVLARDLRWSRTTRASRPAGHLGVALTFGVAYALLYLAATGFSPTGWMCLGSVLAVRFATASIGAFSCLGDKEFPRRLWLLPIRDLLSFGVWLVGYAGKDVTWRGRRLRVMSNGLLSDRPTG